MQTITLKNQTIMKRLIYLLAAAAFLGACNKSTNGDTGQGFDGGSGQGGSLARFTIAENHLYVVDDMKLYSYSLANAAQPQIKSTANIGEDIETIYAYGDKLFIGSRNAMYIYSISDAANPERIGQASHVRACDPVVAKDNYAYVTVRSGNTCGGTVSALMVYDITQIMSPRLERTINLNSPYGLGVKDNRLYVCNGAAGLNVYDITSPTDPKLLKEFHDDIYYDVIPTSDLLIAMVQGGTSLYQYESAQELVRAAKISN
jgi:hypothetical protein